MISAWLDQELEFGVSAFFGLDGEGFCKQMVRRFQGDGRL